MTHRQVVFVESRDARLVVALDRGEADRLVTVFDWSR